MQNESDAFVTTYVTSGSVITGLDCWSSESWCLGWDLKWLSTTKLASISSCTGSTMSCNQNKTQNEKSHILCSLVYIYIKRNLTGMCTKSSYRKISKKKQQQQSTVPSPHRGHQNARELDLWAPHFGQKSSKSHICLKSGKSRRLSAWNKTAVELRNGLRTQG